MLRKTKIIATLGPATESAEVIEALIRAGVNLFRLNMSHAPPEWCRKVTARVRAGAKAADLDVAVLMDMRGPTIRTGDLPQSVTLAKGDTVEFTLSGAAPAHPISTSVNYPGLYLDLKKGDTVLVDNGILQMTVLKTSKERIVCCVVTEGVLGSRRHINLPGIRVNLPALTQKDFDDVLLAVETGCDWVAMSFVRDASHIHQLRRELRAKGCHARIMAKIEDQQAVAHLDEIIEASDAIMVARGDLGIEVYMEELPHIQRRIVNRCLAQGKPVVVATHMLESMITNPVPTRAEVTDVANAVFEEADAIMLSGETSTGAYPIRCVEAMAKIALRAESSDSTTSMAQHAAITNDKQRLVKAAVDLADSIDGASIIVFTQRGVLAAYAAWFRPQRAHIFAFCPDLAITRALHLGRALTPFKLAFDPKNRRESIERAEQVLAKKRLIRDGATMVIISDILETESAMDSIVVQKAVVPPDKASSPPAKRAPGRRKQPKKRR